MKTHMKMALGSLSLLGLASMTTPVLAQSDWTATASVAVQSDYRFRGVSQNSRDVTPQGALNLTGPDGWYIGAWASQIDWQMGGVDNPNVELDVFGGKHFALGDGWDLNASAYGYIYPDANTFGGPAASFFEGIFTIGKAFGSVYVDAVYAVSPEFSLGGGVSHYVEGQTVITLTDWLTVSGNVGHQWVELAPTDYTHADIGATATWKGLSLDLRYVGTSLNKADCGFYMGTKNACAAGFVGTIGYSIPLN